MKVMYFSLIIALWLNSVYTFVNQKNHKSKQVKMNNNEHRKNSNFKQKQDQAIRKLKIEIYSEVLCPDCQHFIMDSFTKAIQTDKFLDYVDVQMYFFGNADEYLDNETQLYKYNCQHGQKECEGNILQNCIVNIIQEQKIALGLIICFEQEIKRYIVPTSIKYDKILTKCQNSVSLDKNIVNKIVKCSNGKEGNSWQHIAAQKTLKLTDLEFVPWILVEDSHQEQYQQAITKDFVQFTCNYYNSNFERLQIIPPFCKNYQSIN